MRDEYYRAPGLAQVLHPTETPALELGVTDREHLVDEQNLGLEVRGDAMQPHGHPLEYASPACRGRLYAGELDDLLELQRDPR